MSLDQLQSYLARRIPDSHLVRTSLPLVPEIGLYLLNADYPRDRLTAEQATALMDNPPYWAFCWASGQVLARYLLDNPALVRGKTVVDFGTGSGVVGIAAAMAGANRVLLCDSDPLALKVATANAAGNGVSAESVTAVEDLLGDDALDHAAILIADVFYDRENLPLLERFNRKFTQVIVADCRLKGAALPGLEISGKLESHTVPDLDESSEFNHVTVYRTATPAGKLCC